jgi:F-type H+-transporting ATPase subunit alpha
MKRIAGTLKLDQAQYRELEAFSKFGSDLDPATIAILDKGSKNVEILKQGQYSPFSVEKQIAIIYCGTKALMKDIPNNKVKDFEIDFLEQLDLKHKDVLKLLREGTLNDTITKTLENVAVEIALRYKR